jgi:hypothetical protein
MRDVEVSGVGFVASAAVGSNQVDVPVFREPTEA